jgi:hypothetical protein
MEKVNQIQSKIEQTMAKLQEKITMNIKESP